jgi:hypothetical protein
MALPPTCWGLTGIRHSRVQNRREAGLAPRLTENLAETTGMGFAEAIARKNIRVLVAGLFARFEERD